MNYFFFTSSDDYHCRLTIPKFRGDGRTRRENKLICARIVDGAWVFENVEADGEDEAFWFITDKSFQKNDIFFIANRGELFRQKEEINLMELNQFTDTDPAYRANLEVSNFKGGWSSYQSEYPYRMTCRRGTIFSNVATLSNPGAILNGCFLRNIFHAPIIERFRVLVFDSSTENVLLETHATTNTTSYISFDGLPTEQGNFVLWAEGFLGIPIYVSTDQFDNISMEHTHPPHESVHGADRFALVGKMKERYDKKFGS